MPANSSDKKAIRSRLLELRKGMSAGEVAHRSQKIFDNFLTLVDELVPSHWQSAGLYFPVLGEVDTRGFFKFVRSRRKKSLFPKVAQNRIAFYEAVDWSELQLGAFGIGEPQPRPGEEPSRPDVVLVPGVAFSEDGFRLGFGAGHYDRLVASWSHEGGRDAVRLIGIAYDFQVLQTLPAEAHDQRLDFIITEERVFKGRQR